MPRPPEIGNVRLYPDRPLKASDKNGYVLKFYCPIQRKRIRKNCGTRDRREARKVLRECRQRLLNGEYVESDGAITAELTSTRKQVKTVLHRRDDSLSMSWDDCCERYRAYYQARARKQSVTETVSRLSLSQRILEASRLERGMPESGPIAEYLNLDALEFLQERLLEGEQSKFDYRSPTTVNSIITSVMTFARYCFRHGWIESVPPVSKLNVDEVMKGRPISESEFEEMINTAPDVVGEWAAESWRFLLHVLWESTFRIGDVLDFSWDDLRHIHPVWPMQAGEHPTLIIPSSQKNRKAQEIPMLPGLKALLESVPADRRSGWVVRLIPPEQESVRFKPTANDLACLTKAYTNGAIARACHVTEAAVRKWLAEARLIAGTGRGKRGREISGDEVRVLRENTLKETTWTRCGKEHRPTENWVGRIISRIGEAAGIVVQQEDRNKGKRLKYASAHDLRRGCAQRLINAGVSAETLKLVMRHKQFGTTERYYGATRAAQSAATEIWAKLDKKSELVGGLVGGNEEAPQLSAEELRKLKALLDSI